jgi:hypothetical protein
MLDAQHEASGSDRLDAIPLPLVVESVPSEQGSRSSLNR